MTQKPNNNHAHAFYRLEAQIRTLKAESQYFRELFTNAAPGRYEGVTVYKVQGHQVRAHYRNGFTAVRVHRKLKSK